VLFEVFAPLISSPLSRTRWPEPALTVTPVPDAATEMLAGCKAMIEIELVIVSVP